MKSLIIKIVLPIVALVAINNKSYSQEKPMHFGGKIGISNSCFAKNFQGISDNRIGFAAGGYFSYQVTSFFSGGVELEYLQQGVTNYYPLTTHYFYGISNICLHTIELPVLLKFNLPSNEKSIPYAFIGHSFGYIFSAKSNDKLTIDNNPPIYLYEIEDVTSKFNKTDLGVLVGTGINFNANNLQFTIDARYKIGYTNISVSNFEKFSSNTFTINLGVGL